MNPSGRILQVFYFQAESWPHGTTSVKLGSCTPVPLTPELEQLLCDGQGAYLIGQPWPERRELSPSVHAQFGQFAIDISGLPGDLYWAVSAEMGKLLQALEEYKDAEAYPSFIGGPLPFAILLALLAEPNNLIAFRIAPKSSLTITPTRE